MPSTKLPSPAARYMRRRLASSVFATGEASMLFPDLWSAISNDWITYLSLQPVPTSRPDLGLLAPHSFGDAWWVYYVLADGTGMRRATFSDPAEAFLFAALMQEREGRHGSRRWQVRLAWELDSTVADGLKRGRLVFLETLPAYWWRDQQKAAERARKAAAALPLALAAA